MALTTAERSNIIKLVVAMFNAAPGATYLAEQTVAYEANGRSLSNLAKDLSQTTAYKTLNPVFQTAAEFATALLTPLGLQANTTAVDFVTAKFNAGLSKGQIAYDVAAALDATTATEFANAKAILANKTTVAEYYSVTKAVAQTNIGNLQQVISTVTATAASVTAANTAIDNGTGVSGGNTVVFTTGIDTLTGTSGNDTFIGDFAVNVSAADQVNGGGGIDTLKLYSTYDAAKLPTLTSIEILEIVTAADAAVSTAGITGLTTLQIDNAAAINGRTLTLAAGVSANLATTASTATAGTVTVAQAATATDSNVTLFGYQTGVATADRKDLTITGAAVTTQTITSNTAANTVGTLTAPATATTLNIAAATALTVNSLSATAATKVVVTGAGNVTVSASDFAATVEVDASAATGNVTYTAEAGGSTLTFKGGSGNDKVSFAATTLTTADKLTGGAGTDTVTINDVAAGTIAAVNASSEFEVLGLATDALTVDVATITNATIKNFRVDAKDISATFNNSLATTEYTVDNAAGNTGTVTINNKVGETTTKVTLDAGAATAVQTLATLTLQGVSTLNLVSTGTGTGSANTITTVNNADNTVINITGTKDLTITNALKGTATGSKVDANAFTGKLTVTGSGFADVFIGGAGADTITGGNGNDTIDGGAGNDRIIVTGANQADQITTGAGTDTVVFSAANLAALTKVSAGTVGAVRITDFTAGTDKIALVNTGGAQTSITLATAQTIASAANLTAVYAGITPIGASTDGGATSAVVVTVTGGAAAGTYLYINDATGGVSDTNDALINITGITGTLVASDFVFA